MALYLSIKLLLQGLFAAVVHILTLKFHKVFEIQYCRIPSHYQLKFYWDGQKSLSNAEIFSSQSILSF